MAAQNFMKRRRLTPFCCRAPKNDSFSGSIRSSFLGVSRARSTWKRSSPLPHARIAPMYHHREWKDVTKFTDGCDLAHRPSVHLFRLTDVVQDFYFGTKPDCSPCGRSGRGFLQVLTDFAPTSPIRSSVHWISNGQHQDRAYADTILDRRANLRNFSTRKKRRWSARQEVRQLQKGNQERKRRSGRWTRLAYLLILLPIRKTDRHILKKHKLLPPAQTTR